jgi:hypothetical protein
MGCRRQTCITVIDDKRFKKKLVPRIPFNIILLMVESKHLLSSATTVIFKWWYANCWWYKDSRLAVRELLVV